MSCCMLYKPSSFNTLLVKACDIYIYKDMKTLACFVKQFLAVMTLFMYVYVCVHVYVCKSIEEKMESICVWVC